MMRSKSYHDARDFLGAIKLASADGSAWSTSERAALKRIVGQRMDPVIRMRRRWFFVTGAYTYVVERQRGGGFNVARVPSS